MEEKLDTILSTPSIWFLKKATHLSRLFGLDADKDGQQLQSIHHVQVTVLVGSDNKVTTTVTVNPKRNEIGTVYHSNSSF